MKPYLTIEEYKRVPSSNNVSNLDYFSGLSDGSAQDSELANIIERASAWIDNYCMALDGFDAAEVTETLATYINRDGFLHIRPKNVPILDLKSLQYRVYPLQPFSDLDPNGVEIYDRYFEVPMMMPFYGATAFSGIYGFPVSGPYAPYISPTDAANLQDTKLTVKYTYVKGYAHTVLAQSVYAGSTTILVDDPTGIKQGTVLTVYDGSYQEKIKVASDPTDDTVTLTRPLLYNHGEHVGVSALPADIKQACILLVNYLLKERGVNSITMEGVTNPLMQKYDDKGDVKLAQEILNGYKRVVV